MLGMSGCGRNHSSAADHPVIRISQRNEPTDLDPATAPLPDEFFIIRALSEGLVLPAMPGGNPLPGIADRWESSPDGLTWTFHLRPCALWSNGDPVTAQDFRASFQRVLSPKTAAPRADLFDPVLHARDYLSGKLTDFTQVGFSAPDPQTLVVRLEHPEPWLLSYAASGPWIPVHLATVMRYGRLWTRPEHYVGNGPFTLTEWSPQRRIVVTKNPRYHAAGRVRVDELDFLRFDDGGSEERAFRAGDVDVTMAVPVDRIPVYRRDAPQDLHQAALAETRFLAFNTRHPPLDRPGVRRALALALDRERLVRDVARGEQRPAFRMLPPRFRRPDDTSSRLGLGEQELATGSGVAEARRELAAAGFPGGRGFPHLELAGWNIAPGLLEAIQAMWRDRLGIPITLATREARVHLAAMRAGDFDIGVVAWIPWTDDPTELLRDFASSSPNNYPHWSDAGYDALLDRAARAADLDTADQSLRAAEIRLLDAAAVAPLYFNEQNWLMRPQIQGWQQNELWIRSYLSLWLDRGAETP